jgi:hypothetical protein
VWFYRGHQGRFLALVKENINAVCAESVVIQEKLAAFEGTLSDLRQRFQPVAKVVVKHADIDADNKKALADAVAELNEAEKAYESDRTKLIADVEGFVSVYAWNEETFGPKGTLGRASEREVVLIRDLRAALGELNRDLPGQAREQAVEKLTRRDFSRSLLQQNREFYEYIRNGVPVEWRNEREEPCHARAKVIDFRNPADNRFLVVRELKIQGIRVPHYNRRADLVCFVNGLPLVFMELKAVYRNIRAGWMQSFCWTGCFPRKVFSISLKTLLFLTTAGLGVHARL